MVAQMGEGEHQGSATTSPGLGLSQQRFLLLLGDQQVAFDRHEEPQMSQLLPTVLGDGGRNSVE